MTEAKKEVAVKNESTAVAASEDLSHLGALASLGAEMFGNNMGMEGADSESYAIPFLMILQKMSPLVDEDNPKYIPGAKAGMILNTVTGKLHDGKKGLVIVPCGYKRSFVQWGSREAGTGGFKGEFTVEQFKDMVANPELVKAVDGKYFKPETDGEVDEKKSDYYADTRSHFVIWIDPETGEYGQAMLALSSSQIRPSKKLMTSLSQKKVSVGGKMVTPPTFANMVKLTTIGQSNEKGSWSLANFELDGLVTDKNILDEAVAFYKSVVGGEVKVDFDRADQAAGGAGGQQEPGAPVEAEGF